jgi:hypothetical protein
MERFAISWVLILCACPSSGKPAADASVADAAAAIADAAPPDAAAPDAAPPDAAPPDAPAADAGLAGLTCRQLSDQGAALMASLPSTCATVDDCVVLGGTFDCDCAPTFGGQGSGTAVSKTAAQDPALQALRAEYAARCQAAACSSDNTCACDAAPPILECLEHRCHAQQRSCLVAPPDAGP